MEKKKILIPYIEAGMGHIVTAKAIADALEEKYSDRFEITGKHILRDSSDPLLPAYERFLVKDVQYCSRHPLHGKMQIASMYLFGAQNTLRFVHSTVFRKQITALVGEYADEKPDLILCTHHFLLYAAVEYKRRYDSSAIIAAYCPDNNVHGWWDTRADMIYTNNPIATYEAYRLGFSNGRVREVFFPTRKAVTESNGDKKEYRNKFGIPQDKFAVAIADGAYAQAKSEKVVTELLKTELPLTVCFLAGKNDALLQKFSALRTKPNITLLAFGYLKNAPQLYAACDLFVTKAGPNAVLDSVMMGTPVLTDYCATPIEKATKKLFIDRFRCGYHFSSPKKIRALIEELLSHPEKLEEPIKRLAYFDKRKNGAEEVADDIALSLDDAAAQTEKCLRTEEELLIRFLENHGTKYKRKNAGAEVRKKNSRLVKKAFLARCMKRSE